MPRKRLSMRKVSEVLRLFHMGGVSQNEIAGAVGLARSTVQKYIQRANDAGITWPLPESMSAEKLDALLFPRPQPPAEPRKGKTLPDWDRIRHELGRKGVTLRLLWLEYRQENPDGYRYTRFCQLYRAWTGSKRVVMRFEHKAGEKIFVDYAGLTMDVIDPQTGVVSTAQIFVAALGASSYTFACAVPGQDIASWLSCHVRTFRYYNGVSAILVPDNLKAGVSKACRYDPDVNPAYQELAEHYSVAVIPARVKKPRDKAKAEVAVQNVERWILAPLRDRRFFSLEELNAAMAEKLVELNDRVMREYGKSRRELFELWDRPELKPLPSTDFELATWKKVRVNLDYHIEVGKHYYSVPYTLAHKVVDVRFTNSMVEVFHENTRVASHPRSRVSHKHTTLPAHMPRAHQEATNCSGGKIRAWAKSIGPAALSLVSAIIEARPHPEQGYRSCLGLLRLENRYGRVRLEQACLRALHFGLHSRRHVVHILENKQDLLKIAEEDEAFGSHANVRGADFYH